MLHYNAIVKLMTRPLSMATTSRRIVTSNNVAVKKLDVQCFLFGVLKLIYLLILNDKVKSIYLTVINLFTVWKAFFFEAEMPKE